MNERSIFIDALQKTNAAERAVFLSEVCGEDVALRARVEKLLSAHAAVGGILDQPAVPELTGAYPPMSESPGTVIGAYKLLQQIGEGGFGTVFMAEQERPVRRTVALKIIKPGMDTAQVIARFESERQALALMDHPNIAKVLEAGETASGKPYFVMELVKGVTITEFCDKNQLPPESRMKLFIDVCHAIQHAHHKGVIHRDIKPSNVMVTLHDGTPVVKVIDFGVAKATVQKLTEKTLFTAYGQMIGTPAYMSPEQAEMSGLDIDTRSDVYSLGVLLYELLTGTTPLEGKRLREAGYAEMQRLIREEEAPRPSNRLSSLGESATVLAGKRGMEIKRLVQLLASDLDWVVMKALEKDRNRRYSSPGNFAEDIDRYLHREAIMARPPSTLYRLKKFLQRNRAAALTSAGLLLLVLLAGVLLVSLHYERRSREAATTGLLWGAIDQAAQALGQALASPIGRDAEWNAARASRERVNDLLSTGSVHADARQRAESFLERFRLAEADRQLAAQIEEVVILSASHQDRESWARMERQFRVLFSNRGLDLELLPPAEVATRIRADRSAEQLIDALELWIATRGHLASLGGPRLTRTSMQPWVDAMYAADPNPIRTGIRRMIYAGRPPKPDEVEALCHGVKLEALSPRTLSWLGNVYQIAGANARCDDVFHLALRHYPSDFMLNFDFAHMLASQNRWQEAIRYYMRCLAIRPEVAGIWRSMGVAMRQNGELARSREALAQSIELQPKHAATHIDLAETLLAQPDFTAAEQSAREAVRLEDDNAAALGCLGRALMGRGELNEALRVLEKCHELAGRDSGVRLPSQAWLDECRQRLAKLPR